MMRYIFDLDNTLIYTDALNNESYNFALNHCGLVPISDCKRITRKTVFSKYPELNIKQRKEIIDLKQKYFISSLHKTIPNTTLLQVLDTKKNDFCMLWTSADATRVFAILEFYKITNAFKEIYFSKKTKVADDIEKICDVFECSCEYLIFYEDNQRVVHELQQLKLNVINTEPCV